MTTIPIKRHKYSEFIVSLAVEIYILSGCGLRKTVKIIELLNKKLAWELEEIPCYNSIENWVKKGGYHTYQESGLKNTKADYSCIVDESILLGKEKMILSLGIKARKDSSTALSYNDTEVIGIHVNSNWDSDSIKIALEDDEKKMQRPPLYIISDNDNKLKKALQKYDCIHIRDVGHTVAMFLKQVYSKQKDFISFSKRVGRLKIESAMSDCSYLLPPRQRGIARFMNLSDTIFWASKMMCCFDKLTKKEKETFGFIFDYKELILELDEILKCTNNFLSKIKTEGLSHKSIKSAISLINELPKGYNQRIDKVISLMTTYLKEERLKLKKGAVWNASSDIIESAFGIYKSRISKNSLHGITTYVFILPLISKINDERTLIDICFKTALEEVYMRDLKLWSKENLTENQTIKRKNKLSA